MHIPSHFTQLINFLHTFFFFRPKSLQNNKIFEGFYVKLANIFIFLTILGSFSGASKCKNGGFVLNRRKIFEHFRRFNTAAIEAIQEFSDGIDKAVESLNVDHSNLSVKYLRMIRILRNVDSFLTKTIFVSVEISDENLKKCDIKCMTKKYNFLKCFKF